MPNFHMHRDLKYVHRGKTEFSSSASASSPAPVRGTNLFRNSSLPASPRPNVGGPTASPGAVAARSGSGAKEMILMWVQNRIKDYPVCSLM